MKWAEYIDQFITIETHKNIALIIIVKICLHAISFWQLSDSFVINLFIFKLFHYKSNFL